MVSFFTLWKRNGLPEHAIKGVLMEYALERLNAIHGTLLDSLEKNISILSKSSDEGKLKALAQTIQSLSAAQYSIIESIDLISSDPFSGFSDDYEDDADLLTDEYPDVIEFKGNKKNSANKKKKKK